MCGRSARGSQHFQGLGYVLRFLWQSTVPRCCLLNKMAQNNHQEPDTNDDNEVKCVEDHDSPAPFLHHAGHKKWRKYLPLTGSQNVIAWLRFVRHQQPHSASPGFAKYRLESSQFWSAPANSSSARRAAATRRLFFLGRYLLPRFWVCLARAAKIRPQRLVIVVEEFCQLLRGYFLDRHQIFLSVANIN